MIWSFVKAYRKQLIIMAVLAVLVISGVVAGMCTAVVSTTLGMHRRKKTAKQKMREFVSTTNRRNRSMNVKRSRGSTRRAMMLLMLPLALAGCSNSSLPSVSSSGTITPLSALGRQPQTPEFCLPTCSANLSREIDNWQSMLTGQPKPEESAKNSTTP